MSQENQSEEIDLMQLLGMIKGFFRKFLSLIVDVVLFYKKKTVLFFILALIGGGLGFFMDQYQGKKNNFVQEVIIKPKYNSVEYLYNFIENLEDNLKDDNYIAKLGLDAEEVQNIGKITLEPVIRPEEVLSQLQDKKSFSENYDEKLLREKKYRNFYVQHKLTLSFISLSNSNDNVLKKILEYLESNKHFVNIKNLKLEQTKNNLEQNRGTLRFVNDYLANLSKNPTSNDGNVIFATESETSTISSLLKRKGELIETLSAQERILELNKEVYSVIENTGVITKRKPLTRRNMITLPLILVGLVSSLYLLLFISKSVINFVNKD